MPDLLQRLQDALADRYRIERELGRGGMATVYLAEDLKHRRRVAIKVLDPEVAAAIGPERFLREIETVAGLTHSHILPLFDSGQADGLLFYAMPFVEGASLRDRLAREKQLPVEDALRIAREVTDALSYAHSHGVVHRDIKPENILLQSGHAVVADFGVARAAAVAGGAALTGTGIAVGTPAYMSPEQASGSRELDGRSDLYSLACVLYEMLAGVPPFAGTTAESLAHQHLNLAPRLVTELRPAVPAAVTAALTRALAKAPADRFNPVAQFGEALGTGGSGLTATATPTAVAARPKPRGGLPLAGLTALVVVAVVAGAALLRGRHAPPPAPPPPAPAHGRTEIAVLPLQNLSAGGPHAYFAGGLHEELLTQLAKVASLKVISRTSVMGYEGTKKPLKQIAAELGVGSIVEGSVQVEGQRLRVNVQLIDAATDEHLWAERYDRPLDDAFAIQSDVAQQIVKAVGAALAAGEQGRLAAAPTANIQAYRFYLQGHEYVNRPGNLRTNWESAQQLYERALVLDPSFALVHAALSELHGLFFWFAYDPAASRAMRAARQREEAETALRLAPDLPQAHVAMGLVHFYGRRDYRGALREFSIALEGLPNDAELRKWICTVYRRMGDWSEVSPAYEKAIQLGPRDADTYFDLGGRSFRYLRRYADAVRAFDTALSLAPDLQEAALEKGWTLVAWQGRLDTLRAALDRLPSNDDLGPYGSVAVQRAEMLLLGRNADGLLQMPEVDRGDLFKARNRLMPSALYAAWAHQLRGDRVATRTAFESALTWADSGRSRLHDDWRLHGARGMALAGLGRRDEAQHEARWLQQSPIYRNDVLDGPDLAEVRAQILAQAGYAKAALDEIERLLARPGLLSVHVLRLDPRWDPIRDQPRFKWLLAKYGGGAAR